MGWTDFTPFGKIEKGIRAYLLVSFNGCVLPPLVFFPIKKIKRAPVEAKDGKIFWLKKSWQQSVKPIVNKSNQS